VNTLADHKWKEGFVGGKNRANEEVFTISFSKNTPQRISCMFPGYNNGVSNPENLCLPSRKPVLAAELQYNIQPFSERFNPGYFS
jgi:hypothetical protein